MVQWTVDLLNDRRPALFFWDHLLVKPFPSRVHVNGPLTKDHPSFKTTSVWFSRQTLKMGLHCTIMGSKAPSYKMTSHISKQDRQWGLCHYGPGPVSCLAWLELGPTLLHLHLDQTWPATLTSSALKMWEVRWARTSLATSSSGLSLLSFSSL